MKEFKIENIKIIEISNRINKLITLYIPYITLFQK